MDYLVAIIIIIAAGALLFSFSTGNKIIMNDTHTNGTMYADDITATLSITDANRYFDFNQFLTPTQLSLFTFDKNKLKPSVKGKYLITFNAVVSTSTGVKQYLELVVGINSVPKMNGVAAGTTQGNGEQMNLSSSGIYDLNAGDLVGFMIENETSASNIVVSHATMNITRIND